MGVRHAWRVIKAYAALHVKTALEYRVNFLIQAGFMFLNDALYLFLFYMIFQSFGTINGYSFTDVAIVQATAMIAIGIAHGFFGGVARITDNVLEGKLDTFLSQPVPLIPHLGLSRSAQDSWGDIALGLIVLGVIVPNVFGLALVCAVIGAVAYIAVEITIHCAAFILPRPKGLVRSMRYMTIAFASWPIDLYPYQVRAVVYGLGIAFIATVPHNVVTNFSWAGIGILAGVAALMVIVATTLFTLGVRRYESGNLMGMNG